MRTGATFHLRDIDCHDGALARGTPAYASLVLASDTGPCAEPLTS
jgi:hypothetical protein